MNCLTITCLPVISGVPNVYLLFDSFSGLRWDIIGEVVGTDRNVPRRSTFIHQQHRFIFVECIQDTLQFKLLWTLGFSIVSSYSSSPSHVWNRTCTDGRTADTTTKTGLMWFYIMLFLIIKLCLIKYRVIYNIHSCHLFLPLNALMLFNVQGSF